MASSYTLKTTDYNTRYMYVTCKQTKNIATNTSTINWTLTVTGGNSNYYSTGPTTLTINGQQVYYSARKEWNSYAFPAAKGSVSGSLTVSHNATGNATIAVSLSTAIYTATVSTVSGNWTLDTIPRGATITAAPHFTDEDNPKISYSNPAGNNVATLQACISTTTDGSKTPTIAYRDIGKSGSNYTFNLTTAERTALHTLTKNAKSMSMYFIIKTVIGGNTFYSVSGARTLSIVNAKPTLSPIYMDRTYDWETISIIAGSNYIRYVSDVYAETRATANKGATITKQSITCGTDVIEEATGTFTGIKSGKIVYSATDSRGHTTTQTIDLPFVEYFKPTCAIDPTMPTTDGEVTLTVSGKAFTGNFGARDNSFTFYYRYKTNSGSYGAWTEISSFTATNDTYSATVNLTGLNYENTYTFQGRVVDTFNTVNSTTKEVKTKPIFDWSDSDFNFNVPVSINGVALDYIVEQGTSGIWTYRKWNSGIAECWGTITPTSHSITSTWGSIYTKDNAFTRQSYPFTFTAVPVVSINLHNTTGNCWAYTGTQGTAALSPAIGLARGASGSVTVGVQITAIGRWK